MSKLLIKNSPYIEEITKSILEKRFDSGRKLYLYFKEKYPDSFTFSYMTVSRYYNKIMNEVRDTAEVNDLRDRAIKSQIYQDIETVQTLSNHLKVLNKQLEKIMGDLNDPIKRKEVRDIVRTCSKVTEQLLRYSDKIEKEPEEDKDALFRRMIECMKEFPSEYQIKFIKKWKEFE